MVKIRIIKITCKDGSIEFQAQKRMAGLFWKDLKKPIYNHNMHLKYPRSRILKRVKDFVLAYEINEKISKGAKEVKREVIR